MSKPTAKREFLGIGEIVARARVSRKALRLYAQRGLRRPSTYSPSGYRLYEPDVLQHLMQIVLLKRAGLTLDELGQLLERDARASASLLADRVATLEHEVVVETQTLIARRFLARQVDLPRGLGIEPLLESINVSRKFYLRITEAQRNEIRLRAEQMGKCLTADEQEALRERAKQCGTDRITQLEHASPELIAEIGAARDAGLSPTDPEVAHMG